MARDHYSFLPGQTYRMPTQYMIVNAFAALELKEYRGAMIRHYHGSKDLSHQRILR